MLSPGSIDNLVKSVFKAGGDAYARGHKANVLSAGGSEANRGRREVATFATARFN
jgi:hypothetical protein